MTRIRAAKRADGVAIGRVHVETWRDAYAGVLPDSVLVRMTAEMEGRKWTNTIAGSEPVLVAETAEGAVVGFGNCGAARPFGLSFTGEVYTLYVLPDYQGVGLGGRLLHALFARLAAGGHRSAVIWVLGANPSRFFYEAMGGRCVAERDEHLWGVTLPQAAYGWDDLPAPCSPR
jgi:L-amino acid N-acyltransferase YncA